MKGIQELRFVRINSDVDDHGIQPEQGEYRMIDNMVPSQKGIGRGYNRESLKGTTEATINDVEYPATRKTLGSYEDKANAKNYFFIWASSDFHRIMVYDKKTRSISRIVRSNKFPWTQDTKITGIAVLDDVIYWADPVLCYYRFQDQDQYSVIEYNCAAITSAIQINFQFIVGTEFVTIVNFSANITGPLTAVQVTQQLVTAMQANPTLVAAFDVVSYTGSTTIQLTSKNVKGALKLTNSQSFWWNYYQINFDKIPDSLEDFYLYPRPPIKRPTITGVIDSSIEINKILNKNWQFAYRQIYINNQLTVQSPFSEIYPAARFPDKFTDTSIVNKLNVQILISNPDTVKSVELLARNSEDGDWFIIKTLERSDLFAILGVLTYEFKGTEQQIAVDAADSIKQQEGTPRESIDLQLLKNKLFVIDNLTGYSYDEAEMSMSIAIQEESNDPDKRYFKEGGLFNVAIKFFDAEFRTDGTVHKSKQIDIPENPSSSYQSNPSSSGKLTTRRQYLDITLGGKPPIWAKHFIIVRSDELRYGQFAQFHATIHYYVRPQIASDNPASETTAYFMNGNKYIESSSISTVADWRYLHLHLPTNIPFVPERGQIVHILGGRKSGADDQAIVLDVQGNMLVLEQPVNIVDGKFSVPELFIELYSPKSTNETNSFYEVTDTYTINNPGTSTRAFPAGTIKLHGDTWNTNNQEEELKWKYDWDDYQKSGSTQAEKGLRKDKYLWGNFETYSKSFNATQLQEIQSTVEAEFTSDFGYVLNTVLNSRNFGRPAFLLNNVKEEKRPSTIRFTNDYIANAAVNGLHTFEPLNDYPLPLERGPINKLQAAGEDVLLAIHSSGTTSMYIGKGIIRSADLNPTLVTTEGVIGTDNQLKYSFGTVHPTSVCEVDGNVFFWDGNRIEPVRYAQNGLTPLASKFGARAFFKETIPSIFGDPDTYDCIVQFDRLLNMALFMFKNETTSMTIGFNEEENYWLGKFDFAPEYFGAVGDEFLGFVNGVPWVHNDDDNNHNTFYGTTYPSKVKCVMNIGGRNEKAWDSFMFTSNKIWEVKKFSNLEGQESNLEAGDFVLRDNVYYADILRDINTPAAKLKPGQIAIRHGNFMSSQTITIEMEVLSSDFHFLDMVGIAATIKSGHFLQNQQS